MIHSTWFPAGWNLEVFLRVFKVFMHAPDFVIDACSSLLLSIIQNIEKMVQIMDAHEEIFILF